jgi:formiminotetrahydrofolate cyclodeaminase
VRTETVEHFLESLAARSPAPGGRTGAALHAAQGAALVAKVARDSGVVSSPEQADALRETALTLAAGDAEGTGPAGPGRFSVEVIAVAEQVLTLAEAIRPVARRTAVADLAAAAEAVRAAAGTARVDVEVDLVGITDPAARERLLTAIEPVDDLVLRAAKLTAVVREQILR